MLITNLRLRVKRANPHTTTRHSNTPFWLSLNEDQRSYTVIDSKTDIVRRIFRMSIDGRGAVITCRITNKEGIKVPRSGTWEFTSIKKILGSEAALSKEELFKVRVKLSRSLKQTFSEIKVSHNS